MWSHLAALLVMLSSFILIVTAFLTWVPPLLFMQGEGQRQPFVRQHAVESLNFQLSMLIYGVVATVVLLIGGIVTLGLGFLLFIPVGLAWLVFELVVMIRASQAAARGQQYRYPLAIRFVQ